MAKSAKEKQREQCLSPWGAVRMGSWEETCQGPGGQGMEMSEHLLPPEQYTCKATAQAARKIDPQQLGNVSVGRGSSIRPASQASAEAGLLGEQRKPLSLGLGWGAVPPSKHLFLGLTSESKTCPYMLLWAGIPQVLIQTSRSTPGEVILYSGKPEMPHISTQ